MNFLNTLRAIHAANDNRSGAGHHGTAQTAAGPVRVYIPTKEEAEESAGGAPAPVIEFVPGKTYQTRSLGDWDCIYTVKVVARKNKMLTVEVHGKLQKNIAKVVDGVEQFKPFGNHSMCAVIRANKERA